MRPWTVESSIYVLCFDVAPLIWCVSGIQKRIVDSPMFFTKGDRHCGLQKVNKRWHDASITLVYLVKCVSCALYFSPVEASWIDSSSVNCIFVCEPVLSHLRIDSSSAFGMQGVQCNTSSNSEALALMCICPVSR